MSHDQQLAWERRAARPVAVAAFLSALIGIVALGLAGSLQSKRTIVDIVDELRLDHDYPGLYVAASVLQAVSVLLLAPVLGYLYRATRYRREEIAQPILYLAIGLPILVGILTVVNAVEHLNAADRVVAHLKAVGGLPAEDARHYANHEALHGAAAVFGYIASAVAIGLAFTVGIISMNARRAGLLSPFMGILGVIVGVLFVFGGLFQAPPIVQYFWVTALGLLFLNRWPGQMGRGPAWETGEATPWPSAAELRAGAGGDASRRDDAREPEPAYEDADEGEDVLEPAGAAGTPHPRSKKRKRKRRR